MLITKELVLLFICSYHVIDDLVQITVENNVLKVQDDCRETCLSVAIEYMQIFYVANKK